METINPDGSPVLIEAVYWQYRAIYSAECDSIEQAVSYLESRRSTSQPIIRNSP